MTMYSHQAFGRQGTEELNLAGSRFWRPARLPGACPICVLFPVTVGIGGRARTCTDAGSKPAALPLSYSDIDPTRDDESFFTHPMAATSRQRTGIEPATIVYQTMYSHRAFGSAGVEGVEPPR